MRNRALQPIALFNLLLIFLDLHSHFLRFWTLFLLLTMVNMTHFLPLPVPTWSLGDESRLALCPSLSNCYLGGLRFDLSKPPESYYEVCSPSDAAVLAFCYGS